jgi:hypothetical protein
MPMFSSSEDEKTAAADWLSGQGIWVLLGLLAAMAVMVVLVLAGV